MASYGNVVSTVIHPPPKKDTQTVRRSVAFHQSVWGDYFLHLSQDEKKLDLWRKRTEVLKHEVIEKLRTANGLEKLELIDTLHHLGISYNLNKEIDDVMEKIYKTYDIDAPFDNLSTLALRFRLLRQNGWNVSSNEFKKFKEAKHGSFKENVAFDIEGMLSLYEAAYFGTKEETILDEAIAFTTKHLQAALPQIDDPLLAEKVTHSLELPQLKRVYRWEARRFISMYEKNKDHDKILLEYAKLDYNILQALHQTELKEITKWWNDEGLVEKVKFTKDRAIELYLWSCSIHFEPQYSRGRVYAGKMLNFVSVIDDFTDIYGTENEFQLFMDALNRWNMKEKESLPEFLKPLYQAIMTCFEEIEDEVAPTGNLYRVSYLKQSLIDTSQAYCDDGKWYFKGYIPQLREYLITTEITTAYPLTLLACFTGAGEHATKEVMDWIISFPKCLQNVCQISRIRDDLVGYKFEQERGHMTSSVVCYMKEYKCTEEEAVKKLTEHVENNWKEINKECKRPSPLSTGDMLGLKNLDCLMEELYKTKDGFIFAEGSTKECLTALYKDPIPI